MFQSTLPYGERQLDCKSKYAISQFQSTLPYGERPIIEAGEAQESMFQSTLPYGERRVYLRSLSVVEIVSIHAPVRGATRLMGCINTYNSFQSTLPYGERQSAHPQNCMIWPFQSTLPYGERLLGPAVPLCCCRFNPRSRTGSDLSNGFNARRAYMFQSTLPYGERRLYL